MKIVNKATGEELDAKKYAMPTRSLADVPLKVNGEDVVGKTTEGRDQKYTYFLYKNVSLYIPGHAEPNTEYDLDVPDDFGADEPPEARKSYYKSKKANGEGGVEELNEDGSIPAGGGSNAGADEMAAKTVDEGTDQERAETPDGTVTTEPVSEREARTEEVAGEQITPHDGPAEEQNGASPVAPKNRKKKTVKDAAGG